MQYIYIYTGIYELSIQPSMPCRLHPRFFLARPTSLMSFSSCRILFNFSLINAYAVFILDYNICRLDRFCVVGHPSSEPSQSNWCIIAKCTRSERETHRQKSADRVSTVILCRLLVRWGRISRSMGLYSPPLEFCPHIALFSMRIWV